MSTTPPPRPYSSMSLNHSSIAVSPNPPSASTSTTLQQVDAEAAALKLEMMRLRERRKQLEDEKQKLRNSLGPVNYSASRQSQRTVSAHGGSMHGSIGRGSNRSNSVKGDSSMPLYDTIHDPPGATHEQPIIEESVRRACLVPKNMHTEMKSSMKESWQHDSTLVGGFFLEKNSKKTGTFGRASRFRQPVGMKTRYYLSNDMQKMQSEEQRFDSKRYSVSTRGRPGTNISVHWNDSQGGSAPGPGAYTPRYSQVTTNLGGRN